MFYRFNAEKLVAEMEAKRYMLTMEAVGDDPGTKATVVVSSDYTPVLADAVPGDVEVVVRSIDHDCICWKSGYVPEECMKDVYQHTRSTDEREPWASIDAESGELRVHGAHDREAYSLEIRFCPFCGRRLSDASRGHGKELPF